MHTIHTKHTIIIIWWSSQQEHLFLLALSYWGHFTRRNVCDSLTEVPYWMKHLNFTGARCQMTRRHVNLEYHNVYLELYNYQIYYVNIDFHHYENSAIESPTVCLCETSIGVKSEEKRMFSQAVDEWEMNLRRYTCQSCFCSCAFICSQCLEMDIMCQCCFMY